MLQEEEPCLTASSRQARKRHEEILAFNETAKAEFLWIGIEILMHNMGYISFSIKKWKQPWFFLVLFCVKTKKNNVNKRMEFRSTLVKNRIHMNGFSTNFWLDPKYFHCSFIESTLSLAIDRQMKYLPLKSGPINF